MKSLTPKQQAIWDLHQAGRTYKDIAAAIGISHPVVSKTLVAVRKKLGMKAEPGRKARTEEAAPDRAAQIIDGLSDPDLKAGILNINEAMKKAGVPGKLNYAVVRRIAVRYSDPIRQTREVKTAEIMQRLGNRIDMALDYMDDKVMAEASFRDLALGTTAMIEKRQLLRGEPTAIVSDHERAKLHQLAPALLAEIRRRGLTIEGEAERVDEPTRSAA